MLLSISSDAKTVKGEKLGYLTGILYLQPGKLCPWATTGCLAGCLNTAGRGVMRSVQTGRTRKTDLFLADRQSFLAQLRRDIAALVRKATREGMIPAVRLDGTSDISLATRLAPEFPAVQFYDYTKSIARIRDQARGKLPANLDLTFSLADGNWQDAVEAMTLGARVAGVLPMSLPEAIAQGLVKPHKRLIDGDATDLRFLDGPGFVWLRAKGKLRKADPHGFQTTPKRARMLAMCSTVIRQEATA